MRYGYSAIIVMVILIYCRVAMAGFAPNIVLGASYELSPVPNYTLTADAADMSQLTDGVYVSGHFWSDKRAVGWQESGLITIEIDIGRNAVVNTLCVSTARGEHAGVSYPAAMTLMLSTDRHVYKHMGDIYRNVDHRDGTYEKRKFCVENLATETRYVLIVVRPKGKFTFIDEIEVTSGGQPYAIKNSNVRLIESDALNDVIQSDAEAMGKRLALLKLVEYITENYAIVIDDSIRKELALVKKLISDDPYPDEVRLESWMSRLFGINRMILRKKYDQQLVIGGGNPWSRFTPVTLPMSILKADENLDFDVIRNGVASGAVIIGNNSDADQKLRVEIGNIKEANQPSVQLREVKFVTTSSHDEIGDALVPLVDDYLTLRPGESKQIWLTVHANSAPSGEYEMGLLIRPANVTAEVQVVPLHVKIWPVSFPEKQGLFVNTWSYLTWRPVKSNIARAIADLDAHHANVAIVHPHQIPWPDASKQFRVDYSAFDRVMAYQSGSQQRLFFMNFADESKRRLGSSYKYMSTEWKNVFSIWIKDWIRHMKHLGLDYQDYSFYIVDEPKDVSEVKILVETARLLKAIDSNIRVYTTLGEMNVLDIQIAANLIDIYQVLLKDIDSIKVKELKFLDKEIWLYSADDGGKHAPPHAFYRLQAWKAFQKGMKGIGFWAYADTGAAGSGWNDFDGRRPDYSVVYEGDNSLISSKRWEAWRDGIEDYEIISAARKLLINKAEINRFEKDMAVVIDSSDNYYEFEAYRRQVLSIASGSAIRIH